MRVRQPCKPQKKSQQTQILQELRRPTPKEETRWKPSSLITLCQDKDLEYHDPYTRQRGQFYLGVDFGKKQDHTVIAAIEKKHSQLLLRLCHQFPLDTPYTTVIGFLKQLQTNWTTIKTIALDQTGVGEYIHEDMKNTGIRNTQGITFTQQTKETLATALRETMLQTTCPNCSYTGTIQPTNPLPRHCPNHCKTPTPTQTPSLHIPYHPPLLNQLNTPTYQQTKTGRLQFTHPTNTHDDMFWATALATHTATQQKTGKPLIR